MRRLYQQVADSLISRIKDGEFNVGERLPAERLLAQQHGVSRSTIREAIIALEIDGLVEVRTGSGVFVVDLVGNASPDTDHDIGPYELLEARRVIEGDVAAIAATRISDIQLSKLDRLVVEMARENDAGEHGEQADRDFHVTIAEGTQNSALVAVVVQLWRVRETSPMLIRMMDQARAKGIQPTIEDHQTILEALRQRNPDAAREAMHAHLNRVIDILLEASETNTMERARNEIQALRKRYRSGE